MAIQFRPFSIDRLDLSGVSERTERLLHKAMDSNWNNNPSKIDEPQELYNVFSVLDQEENEEAAQELRDHIFDRLFASSLEQSGGDETKFCHVQIGGCEVYDNPMRTVSEEDQTIYEWRVGVDNWSRGDNFIISRYNLRNGNTSNFGWTTKLFGPAVKLGTTGEEFYALLETLDGEGRVIAKLEYNNDQAEFHLMDFGPLAIQWWEFGANYFCYPSDFTPRSDSRFGAYCAVDGFFSARRDTGNIDLTTQPFLEEGLPLTKLDNQHDQIESYQNYNFREFLQLWAETYTEGNINAEESVGLANLQERFGREFSQTTILFFAGYLNSLFYDCCRDSKTKKSYQINQIINFVDANILQIHLDNKLTRAGQTFPSLLELRDWLSTLYTEEMATDFKYPITNPVLNARYVPNYTYKSAAELVRAHIAHLVQNEDWVGRGLPVKSKFDTERPTQNFRCGGIGLDAYREFAQNDATPRIGKIPFTEEQLNILLDYYTQFATPEYGEFKEKDYAYGTIISPNQVRQFSKVRLARNPKSALEDLKRFAKIRLDRLAAALRSDNEEDMQNFTYNIRRIQEVSGFLTFLGGFQN